MTLLVDEAVIEAIRVIGEARRPHEACGVLLPPCFDHVPPCPQVIECPNWARGIDPATGRPDPGFDPTIAYVLRRSDLEGALTARWSRHTWELPERTAPEAAFTDFVNSHYAVWHTHPSGNVGPSHGDMLSRWRGPNHLVVALRGDEPPVATLF